MDLSAVSPSACGPSAGRETKRRAESHQINSQTGIRLELLALGFRHRLVLAQVAVSAQKKLLLLLGLTPPKSILA